MSKEVRLGVVGLGNMGRAHARSLQAGKIANCRLAAVCDVSEDATGEFSGVEAFKDSAQLIGSGRVDAVLIATPHYSHTPLGIEALIAAYRPGKQVFAAMFNQRTDPYYQKLRSLILNGELGQLRRINWIITDWFRTGAYYASGGWRATWAGEGGGVLLNQCPHNLDLWQWLFGMPRRVRAQASIGRYHDIEVEDDVTAYLEYEDGTTGVFITSTGEAPGTNRLEVAGERGKVVIENDRFLFTRNEVPMSEFSGTTKEKFSRPPVWNIEVPISGHGGQHNEILQNFVDAILGGRELIAPATEGIHSVELGNAILYSALNDETVEMPLDSAAYERFLKKKIETSTYVKQVSQEVAASDDFAKSFSR
jgi:predicted dehydrogenase